MKSEKLGRFEMVAPPGWMEKIDAWRWQQTDIPAPAEAILRLAGKDLNAK